MSIDYANVKAKASAKWKLNLALKNKLKAHGVNVDKEMKQLLITNEQGKLTK